jgi:hypothetical protein
MTRRCFETNILLDALKGAPMPSDEDAPIIRVPYRL